MFETALTESTDTRAKIENLETAMLQSIQTAEEFGRRADDAWNNNDLDGFRQETMSQQTSLLAANAYGTAVLALRAKMDAGELR